MTKTTTPALGAKSFTCPHCGAMAAQTWHRTYIKPYEKEGKPWLPTLEDIEKFKKANKGGEEQKVIKFFERKASKLIFAEHDKDGFYVYNQLINLDASLVLVATSGDLGRG